MGGAPDNRGMGAVFLLLAWWHPLTAPAPEGPFRRDARLNAVWFGDPLTGWAVGDCGAILHTCDGGRTWDPQAGGTEVVLRDVRFAAAASGPGGPEVAIPGVGWAVGGRPGLLPPRRRGVALETRDGGRSWRAASVPDAGTLCGFWTHDGQQAWLGGAVGDTLGVGLWSRTAADQPWRPAADHPIGILGLDLAHFGRGVAVGRGGGIHPLRRRSLAPYAAEQLTTADLHAAAHRTATQAVLVGDDATVLREVAGGRRWGRGRVGVPARLGPLLDLRDVCFADDRQGWAVGQPGGYVLRTVDGGRNWFVSVSGQSRALLGLHFLDAQTGFAVGESGAILRTRDGGITWEDPREPRARPPQVAVLVIGTPASVMPWPLLARLAGVDRLRCAYVQIGADASADGRQATQAAARAVGCNITRVMTSLPTGVPAGAGPEEVLAWWSSRLDRDAGVEVGGWLVAAIRSLRPAVVVVDDPDALAADAAESAAVARIALWAVEQAADDAACPELRQIGLSPHEVLRTWQSTEVHRKAHPAGKVRIAYLDELAEPLGETPYYAAVGAAGHLGVEPGPRPPAIGAFALSFSMDDRLARGLVAGLRLDDAFRIDDQWRAPGVSPRAAEELEHLPAEQRALHAKCRLLGDRPEQVLLYAIDAAERIPTSIAPADLVLRAAHEAGDVLQGRDALRLFLDIGQKHPAWPWHALEAGIRQGSTEHLLADGGGFHGWQQRQALALEWFESLAASRPELADHPVLRLARAFNLRQLGRLDEALPVYSGMARSLPGSPWGRLAGRELWLLRPDAAPRPEPPHRVVRIPATTGEMRIDGRLAEATWDRAARLTLADRTGRPGDESLTTTCRLAFNQQHLLLALSGRAFGSTAGVKAVSGSKETAGPGPDYVELRLDVDRDGLTACRVVVNSSGAVFHGLDDEPLRQVGDEVSAVRVDDQEGGSVIELAVPLRILFGGVPRADHAVGLQVHHRAERASPAPAMHLWWSAGGAGARDDPGRPRNFGLAFFAPNGGPPAGVEPALRVPR